MRDIREIQKENEDDVIGVTSWCEETYNTIFSQYFDGVKNLYNRLKSKTKPITDEELESILTELPLNLFVVAEALNRLRTELEVHKMKIKQKKKQIMDKSTETSESKKTAEAQYMLMEDELLCTAYSTVISRVESEISFSRELIMGAKKIFDGRRSSEQVHPVSTSIPGDNLPEYNPNSKGSRTYIK